MKVFRNLTFKIFIVAFLIGVLLIGYMVRQDVKENISSTIYKLSAKETNIIMIRKQAEENNFGYITDKTFIDLYESIELENGYVCLLDENMNIHQLKNFENNSNEKMIQEIVDNKFENVIFLKWDMQGYDFSIQKIVKNGFKDLPLMRGIYFDEEGNACVISMTYLDTIYPYYLVEFYPLNDYKTELVEFVIKDYLDKYNLGFIIFMIGLYIVLNQFNKRLKNIHKITYDIANQQLDEDLNEKGNDELSEISRNINKISNDLRKTKKDLRKELEHVKRLEELRKEFIANFTHEMKTPLAIINGNLELLENTNDENKRKHYYEIINHSIETINSLILQMLELSKLEAEAVELEKEMFLLEDKVMDILDDNESLLLEKKIKIDLKVEDDIYIYADKNRIGMVIYNFLSNAIKHSDNQSIIVIKISNDEFSIYNQGKNIEEKIINDIWLSFVSTDDNGTGLGLAIARSILELHDFKYGVRNKEQGVEFFFQYKRAFMK